MQKVCLKGYSKEKKLVHQIKSKSSKFIRCINNIFYTMYVTNEVF